MDYINIFLLSFLLLGVIYIIFSFKTWSLSKDDKLKKIEEEKNLLIRENADLKSNLNLKVQKIGELENEIKRSNEELSRLKESGKNAWAQNTKLEEKNKAQEKELLEIRKQISKFEEEKERKEKELDQKLEKLERAEKKLEDEQIRIRREDDERQKREKEERNRVWNEHENSVLSKLREICKQANISFDFYENNNLPESFDGSIKPDFLIEIFQDQYVIFDAKFSESKIQTYFSQQVPKTVQKIKKSKSLNQIYPTVFFVVPTDLIINAKKLYAFEDGFSFFMVSPDSLPPIISSLKKITEYEFADQLNPQDRENIINIISSYESFIRNQNAANILIAEKAVEVINSRESLSEELISEIEIKRKNIKPLKLKETDMKRLSQDLEETDKKISKLVSPKAKYDKDDLIGAQKSLQFE